MQENAGSRILEGAAPGSGPSMEAACDRACAAIAPAWPLDRMIAVNPHWKRVGMPLREVAARMAVLADIRVFPPRELQRRAWNEGRIVPEDLEHALRRVPEAQALGLTPSQCLDSLDAAEPGARLPLLIDFLDNNPKRHARLSWQQAITHQVSQTCAAYFDEHQADWQPERVGGLYAFWRETLQHDHGIGLLMELHGIDRHVRALPSTAQGAERLVQERLGLPAPVWADYLEALLLTVHGWASWCAYLGWQAGLEGRSDGHLRELLAIRLAWDIVLLESKDEAGARQAFLALRRSWRDVSGSLKLAERSLLVDEVWQVALEAGYQRDLARRLRAGGGDPAAPAPDVQAAFCIDVRSEPLRRALEAASPGVRTLGFAGFFGVPAAYTPLATRARRPQLPGLLAPSVEVADAITSAGMTAAIGDAAAQVAAGQSRRTRFALAEQWQGAGRWPGAAFSYVEAAGLAYVGKLGGWLRPGRHARIRDDLAGLAPRYRALCRPRVVGLDPRARAALAAKVLRSMGLAEDLAPLVLLVGHGSQSANNAHASALDCGACCGQTGEVNARSLAQLLNDPKVREGLKDLGVSIPVGTWFVAAMHNTATDEIEGFDLDLLPPDARRRWEDLRPVLDRAGDRARRERAPRLRLDPLAPRDRLLDRFRRRANDGAETRPEWGLAGNASFVIAPRGRSLGVALEGRSFLQDYDAKADADGSLLEQGMTAPMLVAHWINWQYHASTCDPARLGSGNKVLHNVVGGTLGVFEGNGGDLRIGLSRQSLCDGDRWVHEPLRLTVVIDAPGASIEAVISKHPTVRNLLDNGWLHLWRFDGDELLRYERGRWGPLFS